MASRAAVHETTKVSPYEMMFGRTIHLPIDLVIGQPDSNYIFPEYSSGYVFSLSKKLEKIHEFALIIKPYSITSIITIQMFTSVIQPLHIITRQSKFMDLF
jgi:hypothetical protein